MNEETGCYTLNNSEKDFGKTAIQNLCNALPGTKKVLYLTYNKLLN